MGKTILCMLAAFSAALAFSSCSASNEGEETYGGTAELTVLLSGFEISQTGMDAVETGRMRPCVSGDVWNVKRIDAAIFDEDGGKVCEIHQTIDDEDFGTIRKTVPAGKYRIVAMARAGAASQPVTITSPTYVEMPESRLFDMFCAVKDIEIASGDPVSVVMKLSRNVSMFGLNLTDAAPDNIASVEFVFRKDGEYRLLPTFNPTTGLADAVYQMKRLAVLGSHAPQELKYYAFLTAEEETVDITVNARTEEGDILFTHTFEGVPMRVNRKTIATGALFSGETSSTFDYTDAWLDDYGIDF